MQKSVPASNFSYKENLLGGPLIFYNLETHPCILYIYFFFLNHITSKFCMKGSTKENE